MASFLYFQIFLHQCHVLFQKNEENRHNQTDERGKMVPLETLSLEHQRDYYRKDCQRYDFLDYFQLHKGEGASVAVESDPVCRYLCAVFEEGDSP